MNDNIIILLYNKDVTLMEVKMLIIDYNRRIKTLVKKADEIYIMGHKHIDLDAIGACLGMYEYVIKKGKDAFIVIDDENLELSSQKIIEKAKFNTNIIKSNQINDLISKKSLLVLLDMNKKLLAQNPNIVDYFENIIVIDHHDRGSTTIDRGLVIIDTASSSTTEIISDFLFYNKIPLNEDLATYLLSGIVLDTNNFVVKTSENTFKVAYLLTKSGASPKKVQYLLKQDLKEYIERQKVITDVKIIGKIAMTRGIHKIIYKREELAKIADTLLFFNRIEASFVLGRISEDEFGISARSMGNINVGKIMEKFGGGGDAHEAATRIPADKVKEVEKELKEIIELL